MAKPKKAARVKSQVVWSVSWDSGMMAGEEEVCEKGGLFYFRGFDGDRAGPYPTLEEAVKEHQLNYLAEAVVDIDAVLSAEEIAAMLDPGDSEFGTVFGINGETWVYAEPGVFRPTEDDEI